MNLYLARRNMLIRDYKTRLVEYQRRLQKRTFGIRYFTWANRERIWKIRKEKHEKKKIMTQKSKMRELIEFSEIEGPFPLLDLPNELISNILSLLPMKDRLTARVNQRLNTVEAKSKFFVKDLLIEEVSINSVIQPVKADITHIVFFEERTYSMECFRKIGRNTYFELLTIELAGSSEFHREAYRMIKEFDIGKLTLMFRTDDMENEIMVDSFFLDVVKSCKQLIIFSMENVTAETLHQVYQKKVTGELKLGMLECYSTKKETCISFLRVIGITFRDGKFFSNREIEVYEERHEENDEGNLLGVLIFDGVANLYFEHCYDEVFDLTRSLLSMHFSNRREWPQKNRGRMVKIEVNSE
ncbi:hypothetical protein PMAYCL1PPCAC_19583, partial [Pristionchus mayeri]